MYCLAFFILQALLFWWGFSWLFLNTWISLSSLFVFCFFHRTSLRLAECFCSSSSASLGGPTSLVLTISTGAFKLIVISGTSGAAKIWTWSTLEIKKRVDFSDYVPMNIVLVRVGFTNSRGGFYLLIADKLPASSHYPHPSCVPEYPTPRRPRDSARGGGRNKGPDWDTFKAP